MRIFQREVVRNFIETTIQERRCGWHESWKNKEFDLSRQRRITPIGPRLI